MRFSALIGWTWVAAFVSAATALAAGSVPIRCSFGPCSAQVNASVMQVRCDGRSVYSGAYSATSGFKTTRIDAIDESGPEITLHGILAFGAHLNAELLLSGTSVPGSCVIPK